MREIVRSAVNIRRIGMLLALAIVGAAPVQAQSVAVTLTLDAESVELIRAWRRHQGLDPPDARADERVALLLQRRDEARAAAASASAACARAMADEACAQPAPRPRP